MVEEILSSHKGEIIDEILESHKDDIIDEFFSERMTASSILPIRLRQGELDRS
jgi:hypothetical protein